MRANFSSADRGLAARFEAAEAANARALGYETREACGGVAVFAGVGSPMTHAMGTGMKGAVTAAELDELEAFFFERGSEALIDLCAMADAGLTALIIERGYRVVEFNNLMVRRVEGFDAPERMRVELCGEERHAEWVRMVLRGFGEGAEPEGAMLEMPRLGDEYLAEGGGAAMGVVGDVALLFGDATLPEWRGRGVQRALIEQRLKAARGRGCEWAMATVIPGSASHRNYERCGFELFYMRVNVARGPSGRT